jgi:hypothetical protein
MEVSGQLHTLATLSPGKEPPVLKRIGGWVGSTAGLDAVAKRKKNPAPIRNQTQVIQPAAVTILIELHQQHNRRAFLHNISEVVLLSRHI